MTAWTTAFIDGRALISIGEAAVRRSMAAKLRMARFGETEMRERLTAARVHLNDRPGANKVEHRLSILDKSFNLRYHARTGLGRKDGRELMTTAVCKRNSAMAWSGPLGDQNPKPVAFSALGARILGNVRAFPGRSTLAIARAVGSPPISDVQHALKALARLGLIGDHQAMGSPERVWSPIRGEHFPRAEQRMLGPVPNDPAKMLGPVPNDPAEMLDRAKEMNNLMPGVDAAADRLWEDLLHSRSTLDKVRFRERIREIIRGRRTRILLDVDAPALASLTRRIHEVEGRLAALELAR